MCKSTGKENRALLNGDLSRVYSAETDSWLDVTESQLYLPEDIMILVSSHARVPLLIKALDEQGVPAMAGKQGLLMFRPAVQTMMSLLWLLTSPLTRVLHWRLEGLRLSE